jgi:predicted transcriptional regulator
MSMSVTAKDELRQLVDLLSEEQAAAALGDVRWLLADDEDAVTEEELQEARQGIEEVRRGEYVTLDELKGRFAT